MNNLKRSLSSLEFSSANISRPGFTPVPWGAPAVTQCQMQKENRVHIMVIWLSCERMSVVYMREKQIHIQQGQRQICGRCRNGGYTCTIPNITTGGPKTETLPIFRLDFLCISLKCCNILLGSSEKELLQLWENIYETRDLTFSDMVLHYFTWKNNLFERKQWKMVIWKFSRIK